MIINISSSVLSSGNTALELLGKLPGLAVNPEGGVTMRNKGVIIYINGRENFLSGNDLVTFLDSLTSEQIEKVELISNPSSKYDAAGSGGIINIILKKDQRSGFNGTANATAAKGRYFRYLAGLNLNYRNKAFNIYGGINYSKIKDFNQYSSIRNFRTNDVISSNFDQSGFMPSKTGNGSFKLGADYNIGTRTIIGILFNRSINRSNSSNDNLTSIRNNEGMIDSTIKSFSRADNDLKNNAINFNYKHSFDSVGRDLVIDLNYVSYDRANNTSYQNRYYDNENILKRKPDTLINAYPGTLLIRSFKADYTSPLPWKAKLETGGKASWVANKNDLRFFDLLNGQSYLNNRLSNNFNYDENVYALYANVRRQFKVFSIQLGLRAEQTHTGLYQVNTGEIIKNDYLQFFPSIFTSLALTPNHQIGLNITRRINRPPYQRLNPYRQFMIH